MHVLGRIHGLGLGLGLRVEMGVGVCWGRGKGHRRRRRRRRGLRDTAGVGWEVRLVRTSWWGLD